MDGLDSLTYLNDANYTSRFIRNCLTSLAMAANTLTPPIMMTKGYDHAAFPGCGSQAT